MIEWTMLVNANYDDLTALPKGKQVMQSFHDCVNSIKILDACKISEAAEVKVKV